MKRQHQILLIASTLVFSWLAMQAVHEFGHVLAAVMSGGRVVQVILHPLAISYTQLSANPRPLLVASMGPIVGAAMPLIALLAARRLRWRTWYIIQFFAGFCLIANGAYLAFGTLGDIGDAGDIVRLGSPPWLLCLFGVVTIPVGLWLLNGIGTHFGLGTSAGSVDRKSAYTMFVITVLLMAVEFVLSSPAVKT